MIGLHENHKLGLKVQKSEFINLNPHKIFFSRWYYLGNIARIRNVQAINALKLYEPIRPHNYLFGLQIIVNN